MHLGIKNIRLGPSLPAFLSPNILNFLVENYGIGPITTPEEDIKTLMNHLLDGRCEISNNRAERKAKSYAIGRKAFLFHTSETGAGASAVMYSIVETAKANNLNIFQYLYTVLLYMPDYMNSSAGIEQLMPWSEFIKEQCSGLIDVESNVPEKEFPCRIGSRGSESKW